MPSIALFVLSFMIVIILELLVVLLLHRFIFNNWKFAVDVVFRSQVNHADIVKRVSLVFIALYLLVIVVFSDFFGILMTTSREVQIFAVELLLAMAFIYLRITRKLVELNFMKSIYRYLFVYISALIYVGSVITMSFAYEGYKDFINANLTAPIRDTIEYRIESNKRRELLREFRAQIYRSDCPLTDFTQIKDPSSKHFVYVTTHLDLKTVDNPINPGDASSYLSGRLCTSEKGINFLLTEFGQWYWVIST